MSWIQERKEDRFYQEISAEEEISARSYNASIGGVLLYGILVNIGICYAVKDALLYVNPFVVFIGYAACCLCGILISSKSKSAVVSFLGYNLVVVPLGLVISGAVYLYAQADPSIVIQAFVITLLITGFMVAFSVYKPDLFEKIGGVLLGCLGGLIIAELILLIFHVNQVATAWIGAVLFSFYIGYDFHKAQAYPKTLDNAVDSALDIYLDVINLFLRILQILASNRGGSSRSRR